MNQCTKKIICALIVISGFALFTYRQTLRATLLGHYRSEGYNFFTQLYEFTPQLQQFMQLLPNSIAPACTEQGLNLNTLTITPAIIIWGQLLEPEAAPADRAYNVVFHADILGWHGNNDDFNVNILAGLFARNGVSITSNPIAMDHLSLINVHKHDQIYYSPNNGRFQINPNRYIATFWTMGVSEDRTRAIVTFNVIIDNPQYVQAISKFVDTAQLAPLQRRDRIVAGLLGEFSRDITNQEDQLAFVEAVSVIKQCV